MKRSEMVDLFADYLSGNYDEEWNNKKEHVSAILNFLEVNGMLPPKVRVGYESYMVGDSEQIISETIELKWEAE